MLQNGRKKCSSHKIKMEGLQPFLSHIDDTYRELGWGIQMLFLAAAPSKNNLGQLPAALKCQDFGNWALNSQQRNEIMHGISRQAERTSNWWSSSNKKEEEEDQHKGTQTSVERKLLLLLLRQDWNSIWTARSYAVAKKSLIHMSKHEALFDKAFFLSNVHATWLALRQQLPTAQRAKRFFLFPHTPHSSSSSKARSLEQGGRERNNKTCLRAGRDA